MDTNKKGESANNNSMVMMSIGVLVVFVGLVGFLYMYVKNKNNGNVVFPAGINYTGDQNQGSEQALAPKKPVYDFAKYLTETDWATYNSPQKEYSFKHPKQMVPLIFPGDTNGMVTFDVADVPAQFNIMALIEKISDRDKKLVGEPEEFVRKYWTFFGGLKALTSIEAFENNAGLKGFKAVYVNKGGATTGDNYFFVIPGDDDKMIHFSNVFPKSKEANDVFMRILESVSTKIASPSPTAAQ